MAAGERACPWCHSPMVGDVLHTCVELVPREALDRLAARITTAESRLATATLALRRVVAEAERARRDAEFAIERINVIRSIALAALSEPEGAAPSEPGAPGGRA